MKRQIVGPNCIKMALTRCGPKVFAVNCCIQTQSTMKIVSFFCLSKFFWKPERQKLEWWRFCTAQLVKFPIYVSFWSTFEPVEISQKFNFLPTYYDYRKFLKAYRIHRGMNHSNAIFKTFLNAKSVSIKYLFSCREQLIYAMNMFLLINFQKIKMALFSS